MLHFPDYSVGMNDLEDLDEDLFGLDDAPAGRDSIPAKPVVANAYPGKENSWGIGKEASNPKVP